MINMVSQMTKTVEFVEDLKSEINMKLLCQHVLIILFPFLSNLKFNATFQNANTIYGGFKLK